MKDESGLVLGSKQTDSRREEQRHGRLLAHNLQINRVHKSQSLTGEGPGGSLCRAVMEAVSDAH